MKEKKGIDMAKNAYFQLNLKSDGIYIILYPPTDGGAKLNLSEVSDYLKKVNVGDINKNALENALDFQLSRQEIKISGKTIPPVNEEIAVLISDNKMQASVKCYAASDEGKRLAKGDFLKKLSDAGVKYGVMDEVIDEWLQNRRYCTVIPVAQGTPAETSKDAGIEYLFNRSMEFKPAMDERGVIDFHHLNLIVHVAERDVLAVLTPAYEGEPGTDVCGDVIPSAEPVKLKFEAVQNAEISDDGCRLISRVNGHVEMLRDKIVLHNLYVIKGDVGSGTGDVEYNGSVKITGDVREGYSVKASGDIFVDGVVEAANIRAGGKIILTKGAHSGGWLKAGGDVVSKFIEECTVVSGGSVTSGAILHSSVSASESVIVDDQKGVILGGEVRARSLISAKVVGAVSGVHTLIEVGPDPAVVDEYKNLKKLIAVKLDEQLKLHQTSEHIQRKIQRRESLKPEQTELLKSLPQQISMIDIEMPELLKRRDELKMTIESSNTGKVVVRGPVHDGTKIVISNMPYNVNSTILYCQFLISGGEIKSYSI
ncbi:MAG: FapA family protein [Oscillospiraceae bacterium]|jgi:uncharacterized protein (DUF342 family)|nr:FapA family protein [Oscillospiraceae bacterium]